MPFSFIPSGTQQQPQVAPQRPPTQTGRTGFSFTPNGGTTTPAAQQGPNNRTNFWDFIPIFGAPLATAERVTGKGAMELAGEGVGQVMKGVDWSRKNVPGVDPTLTTLDYLLAGPTYAYAGTLEAASKRAKELKKRGANPLEKIVGASVLNPQNIIEGMGNLALDKRKTTSRVAGDITQELWGNRGIGTGVGLGADIAIPAVPLLEILKLAKAGKAVGKTSDVIGASIPQSVKDLGSKAKTAFTYRGGQPKEYVAAAEQSIRQRRAGTELAQQVGEILTKGLSKGQQERLGQIMKGGTSTLKSEEDLRNRAKQARLVLDSLSQELANQAMIGGGKQLTSKGLVAELMNTLLKTYRPPKAGLGEVEQGWKSADDLAQSLVGVYNKYQPAHTGGFVGKVAGEAVDAPTLISKLMTQGKLSAEETKTLMTDPGLKAAYDKTVETMPIIKNSIDKAINAGDTRGVLTVIASKMDKTTREMVGDINRADTVAAGKVMLGGKVGAPEPSESLSSAVVSATKQGEMFQNGKYIGGETPIAKTIANATSPVPSPSIGADVRGKVPVARGGEEIVQNVSTPTAFTQQTIGQVPVEAPVRVRNQAIQEGLPQKPEARPFMQTEKVQVDPQTGAIKMSESLRQTIEANLGTYMPRLYRKFEVDPEGVVKFFSGDKGRMVLDRLMKRTDIPGDVRAAMGEILEPGYPVAKGVQQMTDTLAKAKLFRWVNDNFASATQTSQDMKQLSDSANLGILAGKWVPSSIADDLTGMVMKTPPGTADKIYRKSLGLWKAGKVLMNPATRARNQMSNSMLMNIVGEMPMVEVMNPKRWYDAALSLKNQDATYQILKKDSSLLDQTFYANELEPFLDSFNVAAHQGSTFQKFVDGFKGDWLGKSYQAQEQLSKIVLAKYWLDQGKTVKEAAKIAESALFDYSKVPPVIEKLRDVPFGYPFITYSYFAIPAVVKAGVKNPNAIANYIKTGKAVEGYAEGSYGEAGPLPDYMSKGQYLRLPFQHKGQDLYLDLNYTLPWGNLLETTAGFFEPQNPAYQLPADLYRNKSSFTQQPIWKETDTDVERMQKIGDYVYRTLMPTLAPEIPGVSKGGYSWQKLIAAFTGQPDYYGRVRDIPLTLLDTLLGIKLTPVDYELEKKKKTFDKRAIINDLEKQIYSVRNNRGLSIAEKKKQTEALYQKLRGIRQEK